MHSLLVTISTSSHAARLLVQLLCPLLQLLLASRFTNVLADSRTRVGLVVLERSDAA